MRKKCFQKILSITLVLIMCLSAITYVNASSPIITGVYSDSVTTYTGSGFTPGSYTIRLFDGNTFITITNATANQNGNFTATEKITLTKSSYTIQVIPYGSNAVAASGTLNITDTTNHTVAFNLNGAQGTPPALQSVANGGYAARPTDPARTGYTFTGWFTAVTGGTEWNFSAQTVTASITLFARWTETSYTATYTVTVSGSYAAVSGSGNYEENSVVTINAGSRSGYVFNGWTVNGVTLTNPSNATTNFIMPANNVTLTANWQSTGGGYVSPPYIPSAETPTDNPPTTTTQQPDTTEKPPTTNNIPVIIDGSSYNAVLTNAGVLQITLTAADITRLRDNTNTFDITVTKQENILISIPTASLSTNNLIIATDFGTVNIPSAALKIMQGLFGNEPVRLSIVKSSFKIALIGANNREIAYNNPANPLTITLPYALASGQNAESVVAVRKSGTNNIIIPYGVYNEKNKKITFEITQTGTFDVINNKREFTDVKGHWAESYISFITSRGLANALNDMGEFLPESLVTRAMFANMFAHLENADLSKYTASKFTDVPTGEWYAKAVAWAVDAGIIEGTGNNMFEPNRLVTREEMATMLNRYIKHKGWNLKTANAKITFADGGDIAAWAAEAVTVIQQYGIINGRPGNVYDPKGIKTRSEYAAIFTRLIEAYGNMG